MVADNLAPTHRPAIHGRAVFALPAGTSALRKTVDCEIDIDGVAVQLSVPDALGALVLKGGTYREDARDRGWHLEDAAVLACTLDNPVREWDRMIGSDRKRVRYLPTVLGPSPNSLPIWIVDQPASYSSVACVTRRGVILVRDRIATPSRCKCALTVCRCIPNCSASSKTVAPRR
ncbi:hypothetical protein [Rhodococcus sp. ACT016]|uniref:hypothetical protein n=1 Tax=Rhodococcus sp. ACT016 TaxID=3134808 RepID=UPI003D2E10E8